MISFQIKKKWVGPSSLFVGGFLLLGPWGHAADVVGCPEGVLGANNQPVTHQKCVTGVSAPKCGSNGVYFVNNRMGSATQYQDTCRDQTSFKHTEAVCDPRTAEKIYDVSAGRDACVELRELKTLRCTQGGSLMRGAAVNADLAEKAFAVKNQLLQGVQSDFQSLLQKTSLHSGNPGTYYCADSIKIKLPPGMKDTLANRETACQAAGGTWMKECFKFYSKPTWQP